MADKKVIRILGIDPGSVTTGVGIIDSDSKNSYLVFYGIVRTGGGKIPARLKVILSDITELISHWQPHEVAIEDVFVGNNAMSALKLGQARGAAICAAVQVGLPVSEYSPCQVKQNIVGTGAATKEQMQHMVKSLLSIEVDKLQADAADALSIALCHSNSRGLRDALQLRGNSRKRSARFRLK